MRSGSWSTWNKTSLSEEHAALLTEIDGYLEILSDTRISTPSFAKNRRNCPRFGDNATD
jgi:hypothetical protein